jgi:hypothetical protein
MVRTEADGGGDPDGGADGDRGGDPDGGVDGGGDGDGGGDPDRGGDLDEDASVKGGCRDVGPVDQTGPDRTRPRSHQCPGSPLPPTACRLLPPLPPTARAPLIHLFWATRLSSELVVVVKIRFWWDRDFGPRTYSLRAHQQIPKIRTHF